MKTTFSLFLLLISFFKKNFFNVYLLLRDRERQSMSMGGAERGGDTESKAGSRLWAVSTEPDTGLELTNRETMTWAEVGCPTDWATQAPQCWFIFERGRGGFRGERGRQRETGDPKQSQCHQHHHELWDHDLSWNQESRAQPMEPPRRPQRSHFLKTDTWICKAEIVGNS